MDGDMHSEPSSTSRRRPRESETESQKIKREKAAERQRRKRERDRRNAGMGIATFPSDNRDQQSTAALQQQQLQAAQAAAQQQMQQQAAPPQIQQLQQQQQQQEFVTQELSPEEADRRDRVRASARERQRKHRQLVKQRRMRELGRDMGNDIIPNNMEDVHYRASVESQYHPVLPAELPPVLPQLHEPPFPQGGPGGQSFASTLLLSFSCAPLLKQHLLRTLAMSNEELASLEPIIAEAWDRWDHQRRLHYAEQVAKNGGQPPIPYAVDMNHEAQSANPFPHPNGPGPTDTTNDFRARFHRSIVGPTPFRTFGESQTATATTPSSGSGSAQADAIDPHLGANAASNSSSPTKSEPSTS